MFYLFILIKDLHNLVLKIIVVDIEITNSTIKVLMNFLSDFSRSLVIYYLERSPGRVPH